MFIEQFKFSKLISTAPRVLTRSLLIPDKPYISDLFTKLRFFKVLALIILSSLPVSIKNLALGLLKSSDLNDTVGA